MKIPTWIITFVLVIGGGLIGAVTAFNTPPAWEKLNIPSQQKDVAEILFVYHNDPDKTQNDIVYVKTKSGDVYSILHNQWSLLPNLPNGEIINSIGTNVDSDFGNANYSIVAATDKNHFYLLNDTAWVVVQDYQETRWGVEFDHCATTTEWRFPPPVQNHVIDSTGVVFEHTISGFFKCYVMYEDGHLEAWSHESSSLDVIGLSQIYCGTGVIGGSVLSLILWLFRRNRFKKELS